MKNLKTNKKSVFSVIAVICFSGLMFAQSTTIDGDADPAANCKYTGNSSDYCYASNGQNNLKVLKCRPGSGTCNY
jgi:hypothetical protein